jgi:N-acetylmuramic acid 6-phosphate etherase
VLNTLTTTVMIRLGKTFGNLMVDVQPTNEKLRGRAVDIVIAATSVSREEAQRLLEATEYAAKPAIVMALAGVDAHEAARRLAESGGRVRQALADQKDD